MADTVGQNLRNAREDLGLSREKVSAELGISSKTLERWEKGAPVKKYQVQRLAIIYGVDAKALLDGVAA